MNREIDETQEAYALWERSLTLSEKEAIAEEESFQEHYEKLIREDDDARSLGYRIAKSLMEVGA
jgi:hypothetical protein